MKQPKKYIAIGEASTLAGVSSKTIRRKIKQKDLKYRKVEGRYLIELQSLYTLYPDIKQPQNTKNDGKNPSKNGETEKSEEYATIPRSTLKLLQDQLKEKDKQITDLKELLKNQQVLHRDLQNRMPLLEAPTEQKEKKRGIFSRLFR